MKDLFVVLLLNGAIGVVVSLPISTIIPRDQRFEVQIDLDRRVNDIATNVFAGTLGIRLDRRYVDLVLSQILSPSIVSHDMTISIAMHPLDELPGLPGLRRFVLLKTSPTWAVLNISGQLVTIPVGVKLPNPMLDPLIDLVTLQQIWDGRIKTCASSSLRSPPPAAHEEAFFRSMAPLEPT